MRRFETHSVASRLAQPPASGVRGAIDALVQGSLVDLFAAYAVPLAPVPRSSKPVLPTVPDISAAVGFTRGARRERGSITLSLPSALLDVMSPGLAGALKTDWTRELANQLTGRIKKRLLPFNVRLELGVSSMLDSRDLPRRLASLPNCRIYTGRTLRGSVVVTVEGTPDESELSYVGPVNTASEGDAILF